jgi:hypothetical protein
VPPFAPYIFSIVAIVCVFPLLFSFFFFAIFPSSLLLPFDEISQIRIAT